MKATIEIPDELYRRVKAKSALQGRAIRDVTIELYRHWLAADTAPAAVRSAEQWLEGWTQLGQETLGSASRGPTATEILAADRDRLERG
jgi:hypothetical protein